MNLGGKTLILVSGMEGSRRSEIAHLMAGGAAYLSTVSEFQEGVTAAPAYHTKTVVLSTSDCFEGTREKFKYDHSLLPEARADVERRCSLAMQREVAIIIVDDPLMEKWEIKPFLALAVLYQYEVIAIGMLEQRESVISARRENANKPIPDQVFERQQSLLNRRWHLQDQDGGTFINREDRRGHIITPETGGPVPAQATGPRAEPTLNIPTAFRVTEIIRRDQAALSQAWKFVMWAAMDGMKITQARAIIEQAMLAQDNPTLVSPVIHSPHSPNQLLRKATEMNLTIHML